MFARTRENAEPFDVNAFFKNIMFSTHFDQTENGDYIAKIINFLKRISGILHQRF